jgi:hypothetical protein
MALYEDIGLLITSSKDGTLKVIYVWFNYLKVLVIQILHPFLS